MTGSQLPMTTPRFDALLALAAGGRWTDARRAGLNARVLQALLADGLVYRNGANPRVWCITERGRTKLAATCHHCMRPADLTGPKTRDPLCAPCCDDYFRPTGAPDDRHPLFL
ncbi:MAG TPA: hypothetical protein VGP64_18035 [Polyangia bacterium]|jgi:hypothetical protein